MLNAMRFLVPVFLLLTILGNALPPAMAEPPDPPLSGLEWATPAIREMQDDAFANPAFFWLEKGEELFASVEGEAERSCANCHGADDLAGKAAHFPKVKDGRVINLEAQVNACREHRMQADPWPLESEPLLSMTLYLRSLSADAPVTVAVDGAAAPFIVKGKALYNQRRGQMNLACAQCHDDRAGLWVRGEQLSQGQINNFPAYLLRWSGVGSVHRRFQFCDNQRVAEPLPLGSDEYLALELYVASRGNGLPVEVPAVRR
jgi:sulfur-oxidizing protein SoxA